MKKDHAFKEGDSLLSFLLSWYGWACLLVAGIKIKKAKNVMSLAFLSEL